MNVLLGSTDAMGLSFSLNLARAREGGAGLGWD
jgi:hypothetical protein